MNRLMVAALLLALLAVPATAQVPDSPPVEPSAYYLDTIDQVAARIQAARQEVLYIAGVVPHPALAQALMALKVPVYVLLTDHPLSPHEQALLGHSHIVVRTTSSFGGTGGLLLLDRTHIITGGLLFPNPDPRQPTIYALVPNADDLVRAFRVIWDQARPLRR